MQILPHMPSRRAQERLLFGFFILRFLLLLLKIQVLRDIMPFSLLNSYRRFKGEVASLLRSAFEIS